MRSRKKKAKKDKNKKRGSKAPSVTDSPHNLRVHIPVSSMHNPASREAAPTQHAASRMPPQPIKIHLNASHHSKRLSFCLGRSHLGISPPASTLLIAVVPVVDTHTNSMEGGKKRIRCVCAPTARAWPLVEPGMGPHQAFTR